MKNLNELTRKELIDKIDSLDASLNYNEAKGDYESISEIQDEIYKIRQELTRRTKKID